MSVAHALLPERQARSERRHESSSNTERRLSIQLPRLMNQIETHAKQLSDQVIQAVRTSPRTRLTGRLSEEELKARFFDLFRNFGRWLSEKNKDEIEATYTEVGRRRCREGMPLNELIYALICRQAARLGLRAEERDAGLGGQPLRGRASRRDAG